MSPDFFFVVKSRLREVKLRRLDSRLLEVSSVDMEVAGRLGISAAFADSSGRSKAGEVAPSRLDIEPFGVLRFLLGNKPN
jgi:hypothetical protein